MRPEEVFEDWCVEKIEAYCSLHEMDYDTETIYQLVRNIHVPPLAFLRRSGEEGLTAYWCKEDIEDDREILECDRGEKEGEDFEFLVEIEDDEMCEWLSSLLDVEKYNALSI